MIRMMTMAVEAAGSAAGAIAAQGPLVRASTAVRRTVGFAIVGSGFVVLVAQGLQRAFGG
ncbi:hypothetical protein CY652_05630 [Burkholderia sp. WAC0059]|uniref:hypothetical protein n=1 Tax=Burkholderia sp. WAC0059 TaxID=2066022 RepID=UPI000C7F2C66|nr:hypothetical protein [Burkholderia sp. WAC0059]PLZ03292.1 hypothetical protein CY652_05630 [Burkholderia sp. WAC0059]